MVGGWGDGVGKTVEIVRVFRWWWMRRLWAKSGPVKSERVVLEY
jgi:hypothetical protein